MKLSFVCSKCDSPIATQSPIPDHVICPTCHYSEPLAGTTPDNLNQCSRCGNHELYRQKDFPQWLGMSLLAGACIVFFVFAIRYQYAIAWSVLLGSAAIDGLIYLIVGDVVICYKCGAKHRGISSKTFHPFELTIAEKYRQERIRREQLQAAQSANPSRT